jgi:tRNA threonylcarbamoyladenosine biosynthesis protein TsaE
LSVGRSFGPADTEALAADLAKRLGPGDVILVSGELGAGKTTFIRGACRALGITEPVVSPTFTIGRRYQGRVPVSHLDLYRLEDTGAEDPGLLDDYVTADAITFVEWPGRRADGWENVAARVNLSHAGGDERLISVEE